MKKLFLLFSALAFVITYVNFSSRIMPVSLEKKIIDTAVDYSEVESLPAINVMTYNIHRGINKDNKLDLDGIADQINNSGAEIIALQEVERFSVRTKFQDQISYLADRTSMQYAYGESLKILSWQYGNAILSRYPIEEYEVFELPSKGERRTILKAGLNINGKRISFYSTHLGLDKNERDLQIEEIVRLTADEEDYIISGDFNTGADKLGAILENCKDSASFGDNMDKATFVEEGLSERIDYVFVSQDFDIKGYAVLESSASDHFPVVSTLKFKDQKHD